jgi:hypothetical protein
MQSNFGDSKFQIQFKDMRSFIAASDDGLITSGCIVFVYDAGTKNLATIYSDGNRTALANPMLRASFPTDGTVTFFGSAASYDIFVNDDKGNAATHYGVTPQTHSLPLNRDSAEKVLVFPVNGSVGNVETDTGLDLPYKALVHSAFLECTTAESAKTVDVGLLSTETAGDADGLIAAASMASTGKVDLRTITAGSNENYLSAFKIGALLGALKVGVDTAGREGQSLITGHFVTGSNAKSISYTPSSGSSSFVGYCYVSFRTLR